MKDAGDLHTGMQKVPKQRKTKGVEFAEHKKAGCGRAERLLAKLCSHIALL